MTRPDPPREYHGCMYARQHGTLRTPKDMHEKGCLALLDKYYGQPEHEQRGWKPEE